MPSCPWSLPLASGTRPSHPRYLLRRHGDWCQHRPLVSPDGFIKLGTDAPLIPLYDWFFEHIVAEAPVVFGLLVAAFEIAVGLLMIMGGRRANWGLIGGIVFLIAITPLSPWTLPNPIMAAALGIVLWRRRESSALGVSNSSV